MDILIGCDPEVFVRQGSVFKSAHGLIKGDKKNPFPVRNGAVQVDGMALEFNINPAATAEQFIINVQDVFNQMCAMVPEYDVVTVPVAHFTEEYMKAQPSEALELGCDPDFNAWDGQVNVKPNANRPMRTAAGHVHIGWTNDRDITDPEHVGDAHIVTKQMDFFLGLGSLFYDDDNMRRSMYGRAGCCRIKKYGVEYRTLSNAWLKSADLMRWVFNNTKAGMERVIQGDLLFNRHGDIQEIINTGDKSAASIIMKKEGIEFPNV